MAKAIGGNKARIVFNGRRYALVYRGKVLIRSKSIDRLKNDVVEQKDSRILKHRITEVEVINVLSGGQIVVQDPKGDIVKPSSDDYSINERFAFMEDLINMTIKGDVKSVMISGSPAMGKTYTVLNCLKAAGLTDARTIQPSINDLDEIKVEDQEPEIEVKAVGQMNRPKGDYMFVKGHASAKALYRLLYENRNEMLVFDDCDGVLLDSTAKLLFKSALDSYDDRWISWYAETLGDTDLPKCFKFNGRIIFITNLPPNKIDGAIKTRAFKVDVSMTVDQCIERMEEVLEDVVPNADMEHKKEALALIKQYKHEAKEVNFRALMRVITIRASDTVKDWKKLARFSLKDI